jgi:hypothetical protein
MESSKLKKGHFWTLSSDRDQNSPNLDSKVNKEQISKGNASSSEELGKVSSFGLNDWQQGWQIWLISTRVPSYWVVHEWHFSCFMSKVAKIVKIQHIKRSMSTIPRNWASNPRTTNLMSGGRVELKSIVPARVFTHGKTQFLRSGWGEKNDEEMITGKCDANFSQQENSGKSSQVLTSLKKACQLSWKGSMAEKTQIYYFHEFYGFSRIKTKTFTELSRTEQKMR